ncbi:type II secretion system protein J [Lysinibacillus sp. NPDC058147]|uniref:PulJ/GspJ family protein n=1 Tax=unclassified Lysinibacillus TaxID=2636778 RepID=UPI0036DC5C40
MRIIINNRGLTLVEVLAVIVILGIVSTILMNILVSSSETNNKQLSNNEQLKELSYVLKLLTKDMRRTITYDSKISTFKNEDNSVQYTYSFNNENNTVSRNNEVIATNIKVFTLIDNSNSITFNIENKNGHRISTQLFFRSGD